MRLLYIIITVMLFSSCSTTRNLMQRKAFTDDFSEGYDTNWYAENHTFENNLAHFSESNVKLVKRNVELSLTNIKRNEKNYTGAEFRTRKMFLYGRFEARLKASDALGVITAFFLYRPSTVQNTEIDFEISGKYPEVMTLNHWVDRKSHDIDIPLSFDTSKDFHTYVIHWRRNSIEWEIDGKIIHRTTTAVPNKAMQVIFNLWATKSIKWAGEIKDAKLPTFAYLDYFKYTPY